MSRNDEFHQSRVAATEIQAGDYLDRLGKVKVHRTMTSPSGKIHVAAKLRGSPSRIGNIHEPDAQVTVWRKVKPVGQ